MTRGYADSHRGEGSSFEESAIPLQYTMKWLIKVEADDAAFTMMGREAAGNAFVYRRMLIVALAGVDRPNRLETEKEFEVY